LLNIPKIYNNIEYLIVITVTPEDRSRISEGQNLAINKRKLVGVFKRQEYEKVNPFTQCKYPYSSLKKIMFNKIRYSVKSKYINDKQEETKKVTNVLKTIQSQAKLQMVRSAAGIDAEQREEQQQPIVSETTGEAEESQVPRALQEIRETTDRLQEFYNASIAEAKRNRLERGSARNPQLQIPVRKESNSRIPHPAQTQRSRPTSSQMPHENRPKARVPSQSRIPSLVPQTNRNVCPPPQRTVRDQSVVASGSSLPCPQFQIPPSTPVMPRKSHLGGKFLVGKSRPISPLVTSETASFSLPNRSSLATSFQSPSRCKNNSKRPSSAAQQLENRMYIDLRIRQDALQDIPFNFRDLKSQFCFSKKFILIRYFKHITI
jgi:hypothetical protein